MSTAGTAQRKRAKAMDGAMTAQNTLAEASQKVGEAIAIITAAKDG